MAYIYCADIYCDDCGEDIIRRLLRAGIPEGTDIEFNFAGSIKLTFDERAYDSDEFPKSCGDDEESDCPQHCGSGANCLNPEVCSDGSKYGHFFRNALTSDGADNVKEMVEENLREGRFDSPAVELWMEEYDYIDYDDPRDEN